MAPKKRKFEFFLPGTPLLAKIGTSFFLVILLCGLIGIFVNVLIDTWLIDKLYWVAGGLSVVLILLVLAGLLNPKSHYRAQMQARIGSMWKLVFGMLVGIPLLMFMGICNGVPSVVHMLLPSEERAVVVTIDHKPSGYYNKGCNGEIFLQEFDGLFSAVCGIHKDDWQQLKDGQKILLIGQRTMIGFSYNGYRLP